MPPVSPRSPASASPANAGADPGPGPNAGADQRIAKLLARAGVASRREVERMIADRRVALNGAIILTPATIIASLDGVTVDGEPVEAPAAARLFLYHKPAGLLVTERDPGGRPTIYDRLPDGLPRVVPVGRLDLGTEGLLLLTTDGGLKRQLELPATGVQRAYRARAYGDVTQAALEELIEGVTVEGVRYGSIDANLERRTGANVWIEMVLTEGKNREVRRVLEYLGLKVSRLIRTRYGPFLLGDLAPGEVVEVRGHDIASFRKNPTRLDLPQPARQRGGARVEAVVATTMPVATGRPGRPVRDEPRRGGPVRAAPAAPPGRDATARPRRESSPATVRRPVAAPARMPRDGGPGRAGAAPSDLRGAAPIDRVARPDRAHADSTRQAAGRSGARGAAANARPGGPARGSPRPDRDGTGPRNAAVAKPARAARARLFRETRGPGDQAHTRSDAPVKPVTGARPPRRDGAPPPANMSTTRPSSGKPSPGRPPRGGGVPRAPRTRG